MIIDGRAIAREVLAQTKEQVEALPASPTMAAITCAPNFETQKYLAMKKRKAAEVGIALNVVELAADSTTAEVVACVLRVAKDCDGVVVQLPLPVQIDTATVLAAVPPEKDPDGFSYTGEMSRCLPPVVGAIDEIAKRQQLEWAGSRVVVLGEGRLVGAPAAAYAKAQNAVVTTLNKETFEAAAVKEADIIISGVGQPRLITPDLVKSGAAVFDAGTSEDGGELVGDVAPEVEAVANFLTPVPGGIGPITIAYLLQNVARLAAEHHGLTTDPVV